MAVCMVMAPGAAERTMTVPVVGAARARVSSACVKPSVEPTGGCRSQMFVTV